jgi:prepilin signal peptidase PulO-like enzyme (type II secretory pathway)
VSFSFVMCIYNWGVNTLPFLYISEIVQSKFKPFTMTFCLALLFSFATIVIQVSGGLESWVEFEFDWDFQLLSTLIATFGMHGTMLFFSLNSLAGGIFVVCFLPETKGKSSGEILKLMEA